MNKPPRIIAVLLLLILAPACAQKKVQPDVPEPVSPAPATGPQQAEQEKVGPDPLPGPLPEPGYVPPKDGYVLVFGPGLARTMAYVGVLRELEDRHVPIRAVVGVEMGAMIGGIWAGSSVNALEWEIHKFKRDTLLDVPLFNLRTRVAEGKRLRSFLTGALKIQALDRMRVPVLVASASDTGLILEGRGPAVDVIRGAMGIPGVLRSYPVDGKDRTTAALEFPFPVAQARSIEPATLGLGKVLCVDVIGRGGDFSPADEIEEQVGGLMKAASALARQQMKDCDEVLAIPAEGVGYLDFEAKADLIYRGRVAVQKWLEANREKTDQDR